MDKKMQEKFANLINKIFISGVAYGIAYQTKKDIKEYEIVDEETNKLLFDEITVYKLANFSQNSLHKKTCTEIKEMLLTQKGINWNELPKKYQRGSCCVRKVDKSTDRNKWVIDNELPIFKDEDCNYINNLIYVGE